MGGLVFLLAVAMTVAGAASTYFGAPIIDTGRGWTMVLSGTIAMAGGGLLLGMSAVLRKLGRIEAVARRLGERLDRLLDAVPTERVPIEPTRPEVAGSPGPRDPAPPAATTAPQPAPAIAPTTVVGSYNSGVNSYDMYADGSIRAETPAGEFRFGSIEEFRDFVSAGAKSDGSTKPAPAALPEPRAPAPTVADEQPTPVVPVDAPPAQPALPTAESAKA